MGLDSLFPPFSFYCRIGAKKPPWVQESPPLSRGESVTSQKILPPPPKFKGCTAIVPPANHLCRSNLFAERGNCSKALAVLVRPADRMGLHNKREVLKEQKQRHNNRQRCAVTRAREAPAGCPVLKRHSWGWAPTRRSRHGSCAVFVSVGGTEKAGYVYAQCSDGWALRMITSLTEFCQFSFDPLWGGCRV